ncbi:MAG: superoxide dismutase family protein [Bacteroidetes bacterium]|nr:superoxide dismutase family protein [Bacteroidota bacterium]
MKKIQISILAFGLIAFMSCKNDTKKPEEAIEETVEEVKEVVSSKPERKTVSFDLASKSDSEATGEVYFAEVEGTVTMEATLKGLTPGTHAIHIHEKADCSSADGKSSGGHWNPTFKPHGAWGADSGYHKGDIGNFEAGADGTGRVQFSTDQWCIGCGDDTKDILGKAIIVHQGTDDLTSQPSGAAGARVSCGGIIK